ncbi:MAG: hypothetical protein D6706_16005, partial [Chloroflexi bacterium]
MSFSTDRRGFLKFAGSTAVGITLAEVLKYPVLRQKVKNRPWGSGIHSEEKKLSVCGQCQAGCGISVRVADGLPCKINGNPICPVSAGKLCPKGESLLHTLYDPDRWAGPLVRNRKNPGGWQRISWEDGVSRLTDRLKKLRSTGAPQRLMWLAGDNQSSEIELIRSFMQAYGSPNLFTWQG